MTARARIGVDIGGTFTDVALEVSGKRHSVKVLTTPRAPEQGVLEGLNTILRDTGVAAREVGIVIHGTTLATNAVIERKGAKTAFLTTEGFRDVIELGTESRFEQYDVNMEKPAPLVPRYLRLPVPERLSAQGNVLKPLDESAVEKLCETLKREQVASVAIGFLHSFVNPRHERRTAEIVAKHLPEMAISLSSEVSPEIREYERFSTTCANAYVRPLMASYLARLEQGLKNAGLDCPLYLMLSSGGITTVETAAKFPIRLVESGPAGGAIFASRIAQACGLDRAMSFDMGGTTAKICLIDDARPQTSRSFEVARVYRFRKGSGIPVRIPVVEMVEIGAGGGSIARIDSMGRIAVGPDSAGSEPGPACYGRGGVEPTVTDADLVMGRIDPAAFAGGRVTLDVPASERSMLATAQGRMEADAQMFAFGISEMVDENMANAARVHAVESGKTLAERTLVAFGGAAPLHAARIAEKLDIANVVVPTGAGVGSAIGFLEAPVSYEISRSLYQRLSTLAPGIVNSALAEMQAEANAIVARGAPNDKREERRMAYMRYLGQGHEIAVDLPVRALAASDTGVIRAAYEAAYEALYGRIIPGVDIEILSWVVTIATIVPPAARSAMPAAHAAPAPSGRRSVFDPGTATNVEMPTYRRDALKPGVALSGPAVIVEDETSTVISPRFDATIDANNYIVMRRKR